MAQEMAILERQELLSGIQLVRVKKQSILDDLDINHINMELSKLIAEQQVTKLLLDFSAVEHCSSAALGMLITINNQIHQQKGVLKLCNIRPNIYEVFKITRLDQLFDIYDTLEDALQSFNQTG